MLVTLDSRKLDDEFNSDCTLHDLLDRVRASHLDDRIVVAVSIDGQSLVGESLSRQLHEALSEAKQVDIESDHPAELAAEALRDVAHQLAQAAAAAPEIADRMRTNNAKEACVETGELLSAWRSCQIAINECCSLLGLDASALTLDGVPAHERFTSLVAKLAEMRDAFEARDTVLLADLLAYEMPELCEEWNRLMTEFADQIAGGAITGAPTTDN